MARNSRFHPIESPVNNIDRLEWAGCRFRNLQDYPANKSPIQPEAEYTKILSDKLFHRDKIENKIGYHPPLNKDQTGNEFPMNMACINLPYWS